MNRLGGPIAMLLLAVFGWMVAFAFVYPKGARLMPVAVGLVGAALCLLQIAVDLGAARRNRMGRYFRAAPKLGRPELHDAGMPKLGAHTLSSEIAMWASFLAFIAGLLAFGFYVAVPALLFFFLWRQAGTRFATATMAAAGGLIAMALIFGTLFGFELFPGLVWPALLRSLPGS
ncbi:hypothetical protein [Mesorhizobium marinum]|uniref:hypothetical protein n=1 Tax=Mesorhizobium marinum TaxID=3228790 RepID=UPI00346614D2